MPGPSDRDNADVLRLLERINRLLPHAVKFNATIVRSVGTRHASRDEFLSGQGAFDRGGRWNR